MIIQYLYYNQPKVIEFYESIGMPDYPIDFLFVDDGSREPLKLDWPNATVIRINENIAWNQPMANNYGFNYIIHRIGSHHPVIRMDIDHYFTRKQIDQLKTYMPARREIMLFRRGDKHPHPNIFLAWPDWIMRCGGYNEYYCGNYGYDDKDLIRRLRHYNTKTSVIPIDVQINHAGGTKELNRDADLNAIKYSLLANHLEK